MKTRYQLEMLSGPTPGKIFPFEGEQVVGGRDTSVNIVINDIEVSRKHFRLIWSEPGYLLEDLGSTNGILINGQKITTPQGLHGGEIISLGANIVLMYNVIPGDEDETILSEINLSDNDPIEVDIDPAIDEPIDDQFSPSEPESKQVDTEEEYDPSANSLKGESVTDTSQEKSKKRRVIIITLVVMLLITCILFILYLYQAPVSFWCKNFSFYFKPELYPQCSP